MNESEAVRAALIEAGRRRRKRSALRDEVARLAVDDADRETRERVLADMDSVSLDWPA